MDRRLEVDLLEAESFEQIDAGGVRAWLQRLVGSLAPDTASFAVRFVDDGEMRRLNRSFRDRDSTTDVLSFPGEHTPEGRHLGDVVISLPAAVRQAKEGGHPLVTELQILLLHGTLHCLGYDHESDCGEMEGYEQQLRRRWVHRGGSSPTPAEGGE